MRNIKRRKVIRAMAAPLAAALVLLLIGCEKGEWITPPAEIPDEPSPITKTEEALGIMTDSLPQASYKHGYSKTIDAAGGSGEYEFSAEGLPEGLSMEADKVSGAAEKVGEFEVKLTVTDSQSGESVEKTLNLEVLPAITAQRFEDEFWLEYIYDDPIVDSENSILGFTVQGGDQLEGALFKWYVVDPPDIEPPCITTSYADFPTRQCNHLLDPGAESNFVYVYTTATTISEDIEFKVRAERDGLILEKTVTYKEYISPDSEISDM